mgnify:FL=1
MKRIFGLITLLTTISLIGIIAIQYSWLKNVITIKNEQIANKVEMVEFEVVESLVEEKMKFAPDIPMDVLPKGAQDHVLEIFGPQTIAEHFTAKDIQQKIEKAFAANGLRGAKFQFAVLSNTNNLGPELASSDYLRYYDQSLKDTSNYLLHVWPLMSLPDDETRSYLPQEKLILIIYDIHGFVLRSVSWMILVAILFTLIIIAA